MKDFSKLIFRYSYSINLTSFSSLRSVEDLATNSQKTLNISKELLEELSLWHQEFAQISLEPFEDANPLLTVTELGYHYIQMTIFRAIMRPFMAKMSSDTEPRNTTNDSSCDPQDVKGYARTGVRSVATAASNFVKNLKEEQFHMFWPHWSQVALSSICFLNLMMAISSADIEETLVWFRDLHALRKDMRLKSTLLPVLRLGLLRIDAVFWKGLDHVLHLQSHVGEALRISLESGAR